MTDFVSSRKEFKNWKNKTEKRKVFIEELIQCAAKHIRHVYLFSVEVPAWRSMEASHFLRDSWGPPNVLASLCSISSIITHDLETRMSPIEYVFENGAEYYGILKRMAMDKFGADIIEQSKETARPCQVPDLISWKHRMAMQKTIDSRTDPSRTRQSDAKTLKSLLSSLEVLEPIPHTSRHFDEETLRMWCDETGVPKRV